MLPLGFHHDEGLDAVAALEIWTKGQHPIFFPQQGSREPLMIYLESFGVLALGATRLGARIAQACVGTAGVVAVWFLVREVLRGRRVAVLATAVTAVSFWQMFESRLGLRAISLPLFQTLGLLFFWRTLTRRSWSDAALAGILLGLTMYTYSASRALPILVAVLVLWHVATSPTPLAKLWGRLLMVSGTWLAVFAPLGLYALRNPEEFFGRSLQVNILSPQPFTGAAYSGGVGPAVLKTLGMFSVQGDPAWKYNIGGLPVFDWLMSVLFYSGLVLAFACVVAYVKQPRRDRPTASPHAFLLLWMAIMLLPGFLTSEAPHFLRTMGVIPAVFVFPAVALDWLVGRWRGMAGLVAIALVGEGGQTGYRYFQQWAHSSEAYYAMQADAAEVAAVLNQQPASDPVLFSSEYPGHPTLLYLAPSKFESIRWFNGREGFAFAPPGRSYLYVLPARYQPSFLDPASLFAPGQLTAEGHDPEGGVAYRVYRGSPATPAPAIKMEAELGGLAHLDGAAFPSSATAGDAVQVLEYLHAHRQGTPDTRAFLHLVDGQGNLWAQADNLGYYAEDWQPGDATVNAQRLDIPAYAPPLRMKLLFGLYSVQTGRQLPVGEGGTDVELGTIQVQPGAGPPSGWRPPHALERELAPGVTLAGYDLARTNVMAGDSLPVSLFWRIGKPAANPPGLTLPGVATSELGLKDLLPPEQWPAGVIEDRRQVRISPTARSGSAPLEIGEIKLADVRILEPKREFQLPAVKHQLGLPVGEFARLAGFEVEQPQSGQPLRVTLVWQDVATTSTSYKVFVHVLDPANRVVAQRDELPQAGAAPTTFWVPGQVVVDRYEVPLPEGLPAQAQLEVGMYDPNSGKRVSMGSDDRVLLPLSS